MAARKCFASLTTVKLLTLEKVITLSDMALTEKVHDKKPCNFSNHKYIESLNSNRKEETNCVAEFVINFTQPSQCLCQKNYYKIFSAKNFF